MEIIEIYENGEFGKIRSLLIDNIPWFVLSDVCRALSINNSRNVATRLDNDEKDVRLVDTLGGTQTMTIINESGLYSVILRSDKPRAKIFRKWITSEVLPSIRRTGSYTCGTNPDMQALNERLDRLEYALLDKRMETLEAVKEVRDYRRPEQFPPHIKAALDCMIEHDIRLGAIMDFLDDNGIWVPKYELQRYIKRKVDEIV